MKKKNLCVFTSAVLAIMLLLAACATAPATTPTTTTVPPATTTAAQETTTTTAAATTAATTAASGATTNITEPDSIFSILSAPPYVPSPLPAGVEEPTLPIVDEPLTLTYFIGMDFAKIGVHTDNYAKVAGYAEMAKDTGITIEFIHPPDGQSGEKFNLMVASGDLPDMIFWGWTGVTGGPQKMLDDNIILPLNDLVDQYAPYWKNFMDENPLIKKMSITDDGTLYSFPIVRYKQSTLAPYGWQIRGDWMEAAGWTEPPETIDEWHDFLTDVKEADPAGDGKTIPYAMYQMQNGRGPRIFLWAYGVEYGWCLDKDGKANFGPYDPVFRDFLTVMSQWYAEGLIDPDFAAINTNTAIDAKIANNEAACWFGGLGDTMGRYIAAYAQDPDSTFYVVPASAPTLIKGEKGWNFQFDQLTVGSGAAVTTKSQHPVESTKWLDYHYSPKGHMQMCWGVEGLNYNIIDGMPVFTDEVVHNPNGWSVDVALGQYAVAVTSDALILDPRVREYRMWATPVQRDASMLWNGDLGPDRQMPPLTLSSEESERYYAKMNDIWTYVHETTTKFIMGQIPMSDYSQYEEQLKSMGIEEMIEIQQAAVDRYNAR